MWANWESRPTPNSFCCLKRTDRYCMEAKDDGPPQCSQGAGADRGAPHHRVLGLGQLGRLADCGPQSAVPVWRRQVSRD